MNIVQYELAKVQCGGSMRQPSNGINQILVSHRSSISSARILILRAAMNLKLVHSSKQRLVASTSVRPFVPHDAFLPHGLLIERHLHWLCPAQLGVADRVGFWLLPYMSAFQSGPIRFFKNKLCRLALSSDPFKPRGIPPTIRGRGVGGPQFQFSNLPLTKEMEP